MKKIILICLMGLCCAQTAIAQLPFKVETFTLKNGLEVILIPNDRAPVIYHSLWYKVGSADSLPEQSGMAHFLEHLMFKGSEHYPGDQFKKIITQLGGNQNANTTWDRTAYFVTIAKKHLETILKMEADRMQYLVFKPDVIEKEKQVVLEERQTRIEKEPTARLFEAANAAFFWQHPYGKPVIGFQEHIKQYTLEQAKTFYETWYAPNNAILVIAGDIRLNELKPLVEKYYGVIPKKNLPKRHRAIEPDHGDATQIINLFDKKINTPFLQRAYPVANHRTAGVEQEMIFSLLARILGDSTHGRFQQYLVEAQKIALMCQADYSSGFYDPYSLTISAVPQNIYELSKLEAAIDAELARFILNGPTVEEVNLAKKNMKFEFYYYLDALSSMANYLGENRAIGYQLNDLVNWMALLKPITAKQIQAAAKTLFSKPASLTAYAYPHHQE